MDLQKRGRKSCNESKLSKEEGERGNVNKINQIRRESGKEG